MTDAEAAQALTRLRRTLRERLGIEGLTTGNLKQRTGLSRTTLSNALNDRHDRPSWNTVAAIAKALRFSPEKISALHELWEQSDPSGSVATAPVPLAVPEPTMPLPFWRRRPRLLLGATATAVILTAGAGVPLWLNGSDSSDHKSPSGKHPKLPAPAASGPLLVTSKWPTFKSCDGGTAVAMPAGGKPLTDFTPQTQDFRTVVTTPKNQGGTWGSGHLYVDLSTKDDTTVTIDEIHLSTRVPERINAPAWVALTQGGCGDVQDRVFELDLDKPRLIDQGVQGQSTPGDKPAPTNPLGSGFTVNAKDPAIVRVDATACHGNYRWSLVIDYSYNGKTLQKKLGPFTTFSVPNADTRTYVPNLSTGDIGAPLPEPSAPTGCPETSR
ncbi:helix-turn-helix domain-containing protein [Streptomyces sp. NBC_00370]|uniref:helix-turn-helix domain-containing protein n=1 Tax=Streptomyces sp. NBC_00370 TaxID=2975728 RepID=UPI002E25E5BB